MADRAIFISYSHKDEALLEEFRAYLKPWEQQAGLSIFSVFDDIHPGDRWHETILAALDSTRVGVLLVSEHFMASDYVMNFELPALLAAREQGRGELAVLYLSPSAASSADWSLPVDIAGERVPLRLIDYQGLNQPDQPLSGLDEHRRAEVLRDAAGKVKDLVLRRAARPRRPDPAARRSLVVRLRSRPDGKLQRDYLYEYGRLHEHRGEWRPAPDPGDREAVGAALFEALFGTDEDIVDRLLHTLFEPAPGEKPTPIRHPLRVRLMTTDLDLAAQPWHWLRWRDHDLWELGWTVELFSGDDPQRPSDDCRLRMPCPVLWLLPQPASVADLGRDPHARALQERIDRAWPGHGIKPARLASWDATRDWCRRHRPRIVVLLAALAKTPSKSSPHSRGRLPSPSPSFEGEGRGGGDQGPIVQVLFETDDGTADPRNLADLGELWAAHPPTVLLLNLIGENGSQAALAAEPLAREIPVVVVQSAPLERVREARLAALRWLQALLEEGESVDPAWALHRDGLDSAVLWADYESFRVQTEHRSPKQQLARLLLDRRTQRALGLAAVNELVRDGRRRLCCLVACGGEGSLVEDFGDQLLEHLRRDAKEVAHTLRLRLSLPDIENFEVETLTQQVRRELDLAPRESLCADLARRRPRTPGRARPLLLLDWGARGLPEDPGLGRKGFESWVDFCHRAIAAHCSEELRILSYLGIHGDPDSFPKIARTVERLRADERFREACFRLELVEPLHDVRASDLAEYLDGDYSSCPADLTVSLPELIVAHTGGDFARTVATLERAEREGWWELHDGLVAESAGAAGIQDDDEDW